MFSTIFSNERTSELINLDQISKDLEKKGYTFFKPKRGQLESGLSTSSFMVKKNDQTIIIFVMKLSPNSFICAGYNKCELIQEQQLRYQSQIADRVDRMFNKIKQFKPQDANKIDRCIENIKNTAVRAQKNHKDQISFLQVMKITDEYSEFLNYEKKIYQKIIAQSQYVIDNKKKIKEKNQQLLEPLLKAEQSKQSLQNVILAYQDQKQYLSKPKRIFDELIEQKKKLINDLSAYTLNETMFDSFLDDIIAVQELKVKAKALGI